MYKVLQYGLSQAIVGQTFDPIMYNKIVTRDALS